MSEVNRPSNQNIRAWLEDYASCLQALISNPDIDPVKLKQANKLLTDVVLYLRQPDEPRARRPYFQQYTPDYYDGSMMKENGGEWYSASEVDAYLASTTVPPSVHHFRDALQKIASVDGGLEYTAARFRDIAHMALLTEPMQASPPTEDDIEAAYWLFDHKKKERPMPMSERDAFKLVLRSFLAGDRESSTKPDSRPLHTCDGCGVQWYGDTPSLPVLHYSGCTTAHEKSSTPNDGQLIGDRPPHETSGSTPEEMAQFDSYIATVSEAHMREADND